MPLGGWGVTFSVSASRTHNSPLHMKSNHLSFCPPTPLIHPSPRRSALLDLIKGETPDLSPFKWCHSLATSSTSPPPFSPSFSSAVYHFLDPLPPSLHLVSLFSTFSLPPCHPFISHPAILSPCRPPPPPPPLLHFSSLLSSAPYCSINLTGRRSISAPRLLFFPSFPAPLSSLSELIFSSAVGSFLSRKCGSPLALSVTVNRLHRRVTACSLSLGCLQKAKHPLVLHFLLDLLSVAFLM